MPTVLGEEAPEEEAYVAWTLLVLTVSVTVATILDETVTKVVGLPVEDVSGLVLLAPDVKGVKVLSTYVLLLELLL